MVEIPEIPDPEAYEQAHDKALLAVMDANLMEDPEEDQMSFKKSSKSDETKDEEDPEDDPVEEEPFIPETSAESDDYEELTPELVGLEDASSDDPDLPSNNQYVAISAPYHDWVVANMTVDLATSEAREGELRAQCWEPRTRGATTFNGTNY